MVPLHETEGRGDAIPASRSRACVTHTPLWLGAALMGAPLALIAGLRHWAARFRGATPDVCHHDLAGRLIDSQEQERTRIARDLHDGVCQELAALSVDISTLSKQTGLVQSHDVQKALKSIHRRAADVAEQVRILSHGLHSSVLHHIGLVAALESHCDDVERLHHLDVTLRVDGNMEQLSPAVALSLFRITQEAIHNTIRHGRARRVVVILKRNHDHVTLQVTDDGVGFEIGEKTGNGGLGLVSIDERARLVQGHAVVRSTRGQGTSVEVEVPA